MRSLQAFYWEKVQQSPCPVSKSDLHILDPLCRSGERVWKASHKDWLKCQIIKIFFLADKTPSLICQNGLLYTLDHTSSAVSVSNFSKVCVSLSSGSYYRIHLVPSLVTAHSYISW